MSATEFDLTRLDRYLSSNISSFFGLSACEKFSGGQSNPTYRLVADSGVYVLRRKPSGALLSSAHAIDREYRVLKALSDTDVPVGHVFHYCDDESVIGSSFYLMEFLDGVTYWDPRLPDFAREDRSRVYDQQNLTLAAIHNVNLEHSGLQDYGKQTGFYERQVRRWTHQFRVAQIESFAQVDTLIDWLAENRPQDDGRVCLIHGDYRIDNLMFDRSRPNVIAVLDWELSTIGHPYSDLAYQCVQWRLPANELYKGLGDVRREELGIPSEQAYVEAYCERTSIPGISNWEFYLAFSYFRLAAICQGILKRAVDGNASNDRAIQVGGLAKPLVLEAIKTIEQGG